MVNNYFIKSCTVCRMTTHKENLKLSQDHLNRDALFGILLQGIFGKTFIFALLSSAAFHLQNHISDFS